MDSPPTPGTRWTTENTTQRRNPRGRFWLPRARGAAGKQRLMAGGCVCVGLGGCLFYLVGRPNTANLMLPAPCRAVAFAFRPSSPLQARSGILLFLLPRLFGRCSPVTAVEVDRAPSLPVH
jgi:hypothetical protein